MSMNIFFLTTLMVFATCLCSGGAFTTTPTPAAPARRCSTAKVGTGDHFSGRCIAISAAAGNRIPSSGIATNVNNNNDSFRSSTSTRLLASRRDTLTNAVGVGVAFLSASVPTNANANPVVAKSTDAVQAQAATKPRTTCQDPCFTGVWSDPQHPKGYRVLIRKSYTAANMILSDGASTDDDTNPKTYDNIGVKVKEDPKKGETYLTFDLSAKGGPKSRELVGTGPKSIVGTVADHGNKIVFPDGNVWTKNVATAVEGVYATDMRVAMEGYRVVVIRKDPDNSNTLAVQLNKDQAITATIEDGKSKDGTVGIQFVFPDKKIVDATYTNSVIKFPFPVQSNASGNTWTKWDEWTKL